jgi:hypothetical protein
MFGIIFKLRMILSYSELTKSNIAKKKSFGELGSDNLKGNRGFLAHFTYFDKIEVGSLSLCL